MSFCESCIIGKQHRKQFPKVATRIAQIVLDLIHIDICDVDKHIGYKYFLTFIDDYSHYTKVYLLKHKVEVIEKF